MDSQVLLDPEQERTLCFLVEASRAVGPDNRRPFYGLKVIGSANLMVQHPGIPKGHPGLYPGDVEQLAEEGLLRLNIRGSNTWVIDVTPLGYRHYEQIRQEQSSAAAAVTGAVQEYLDFAGFANRHPQASEKWRAAADLLWSTQSERADQQTTVGHLCREAQQAFISSLMVLCPTPDAPSDPAKTVSRLQAILRAHAPKSTAVAQLGEAMAGYWGAVSDIVQRQEHGAQKEGEPLTWEDSRRAVFQTMFLMSELDRLLAVSRATYRVAAVDKREI